MSAGVGAQRAVNLMLKNVVVVTSFVLEHCAMEKWFKSIATWSRAAANEIRGVA